MEVRSSLVFTVACRFILWMKPVNTFTHFIKFHSNTIISLVFKCNFCALLQRRTVMVKLPVPMVMVVTYLLNVATQCGIVEITQMKQTVVTPVMNKVV